MEVVLSDYVGPYITLASLSRIKNMIAGKEALTIDFKGIRAISAGAYQALFTSESSAYFINLSEGKVTLVDSTDPIRNKMFAENRGILELLGSMGDGLDLSDIKDVKTLKSLVSELAKSKKAFFNKMKGNPEIYKRLAVILHLSIEGMDLTVAKGATSIMRYFFEQMYMLSAKGEFNVDSDDLYIYKPKLALQRVKLSDSKTRYVPADPVYTEQASNLEAYQFPVFTEAVPTVLIDNPRDKEFLERNPRALQLYKELVLSLYNELSSILEPRKVISLKEVLDV